jgi:hypothetical protein
MLFTFFRLIERKVLLDCIPCNCPKLVECGPRLPRQIYTTLLLVDPEPAVSSWGA